MGTSATSPFHQRIEDREPTILVGWTADVMHVWPEESDELIGVDVPLSARACTTTATPEAVLELLAAVEGDDIWSYARRHLSEAGSILALTHHTVAAILTAAADVDVVRPSAVLEVLHRSLEATEPIELVVKDTEPAPDGQVLLAS